LSRKAKTLNYNIVWNSSCITKLLSTVSILSAFVIIIMFLSSARNISCYWHNQRKIIK